MTKRRIEKKIEELEEDDGDDGTHILIVCEHDDGTVRDPNGEPITEEELESANIVLDITPKTTETWPDTTRESGATEP